MIWPSDMSERAAILRDAGHTSRNLPLGRSVRPLSSTAKEPELAMREDGQTEAIGVWVPVMLYVSGEEIDAHRELIR